MKYLETINMWYSAGVRKWNACVTMQGDRGQFIRVRETFDSLPALRDWLDRSITGERFDYDNQDKIKAGTYQVGSGGAGGGLLVIHANPITNLSTKDFKRAVMPKKRKATRKRK